ncbi:MAG: peptidoglycan bridge formation glycyltransferase FemA/FemB family protein [Actinomycetota bacterium]|nr:peptidoglycan bridge formation glycyltransferase FemA/FemB family protein [Actinomycetota bacterium]
MSRVAKLRVPFSASEREWDAFAAAGPWGSFLQTAAWGRFKERWGWRARRVTVERYGELVAGAQVLFRPLPLGRSVAYVPRGPVAPPDDPDLLAALLDEVHRAARAEGALLLTVEPNWESPTEGTEHLGRLGFRRGAEAMQAEATLLLDLRPSEEDLLAGMRPKWRYNVRLSERKGVAVREGGAEDFSIYERLMRATGERDRFEVRPRGYYEDAWHAFGEDGKLFVAEHEGKALAAIIVVKTGGTATYLYGASSDEERNRMPNHALQWAAIRWAKRSGCKRYDFWGIPPEVPDDGDAEQHGEGGLWGAYRFKQGFGGRVVKYPRALDFPYSRLGYAA